MTQKGEKNGPKPSLVERITERAHALGSARKKTFKSSSSVKVEEMFMPNRLAALNEMSGFIGGCLVDSESGLMLASEGGTGKLDLDAAAALNAQVVKAKLKAIELLGLDTPIEDILITLGSQYHLIRPLEKNPTVFLYVALDRKSANLGMARMEVKKLESTITI